MKSLTFFLGLGLFWLGLSAQAGAADLDQACSLVDCPIGTRAVTYSPARAMYYACPTRELSEYVNNLMGLATLQLSQGVALPALSPDTGEPQYTGETKTAIDTLRANARVSRFDQAAKACFRGRENIRVTVVNNPPDGMSIWVSGQNRKTLWLPRFALQKL